MPSDQILLCLICILDALSVTESSLRLSLTIHRESCKNPLIVVFVQPFDDAISQLPQFAIQEIRASEEG